MSSTLSLAPSGSAVLAPPAVVDLRAAGTQHDRLIGTKAAGLAALARAGFPVPPGFVVTTSADVRGEHRSAIASAATRLSTGPLAVRSSALAEDMADASYAGQYETVLGVAGEEALLTAIEHVRASGGSDRVRRYREEHQEMSEPIAVAVLIQPMIAAQTAGVAFTADPLTGDRATTIVTAVAGLGDRLAAGEVTPDEWSVRDGIATVRRDKHHWLDPEKALAVAGLARRIEGATGVPQDVEWAAVGDEFFVLQARPMTALPEPLSWDPGQPGVWLRNFRFGEWLGDPVTPLFESWALTMLEERLHANYSSMVGGIKFAGPLHVVINGWYFYGGLNVIPTTPRAMLPALIRYILPSFVRHFRRTAMGFPPLARFGVELFYREWREQIQPRYRQAVADAARELETADERRLVGLIGELLNAAGDYFSSLTAVGGYATKAQLPLARFYRRELQPAIGGSHLDLLSGTGDSPPHRQNHAVHTLDWFEPISEAGESKLESAAATERYTKARDARFAAEARARAALATNARQLARFERLLAEAQRFSRAREEQAAEFTLPWPVLRRAVLRLGRSLVARRVLTAGDQVFFLHRTELLAAAAGSGEQLMGRTDERRRVWDGQRALCPPLQLGTLPPMLQRVLGDGEALRGATTSNHEGLIGIPASAGRARGPVRVVRSTADFERVQPGDVLVASMTAPAWTPLFGRVAAVVTDNGGVAAHASIVAREYGLPAVVGTGDATSRLTEGELVEVDGSAGVVRYLAGDA
jgi:phosphohistidine swiveling domain-containing protein